MTAGQNKDSSEITVREARQQYFRENGFADDGGYTDKWVYLEFGWLTVPVYNSQSRRKAVPLHDLHHIATGFSTDPKGEAGVAIWEIAAGTHDKWFALLINLPALLYGFVLWPGYSWEAWRWGRASTSLYKGEFADELLDMTVQELKERTVGGKTSG